MISFPNCKINLGLHITGKRDDGYHQLETVFLPLDLKDAIEIVHARDTNSALQYSASGTPIEGDPANNLCIKAYDLLKKDFPQLPAINFHLHKVIPTGAGLGGGSADGAFMLKLLNTKFNLGISTERLIQYALQLGSDCPFFIYNQPCFATGRGEIMEPVALNLTDYKFLIVNPGIHIHTGQAFSQLTPQVPSHSIKETIAQPVNTWKGLLKNDFETPVFTSHPILQDIKDSLYHAGALYASMSGSGSTVYGIFEKGKKIIQSFLPDYFVKELLPL